VGLILTPLPCYVAPSGMVVNLAMAITLKPLLVIKKAEISNSY